MCERTQKFASSGARGRVNYLEFIALKGPTDSEEPQRHAEVMLLCDDTRYGVRAIVALGAKPAVVSVQRVEESNVPMTEIELQSAVRLASDHAEVRTAIGPQLAQMGRKRRGGGSAGKPKRRTAW